jgi:DNA-binding SARP family transcriptional activator
VSLWAACRTLSRLSSSSPRAGLARRCSGSSWALDERRLLAVEAKAEADLALGRCDVVAAEIATWLSLQPLRERLRGLAMLALYRLGCRADALNL